MLFSLLLMLPQLLSAQADEVSILRYRGQLLSKDADGFNPIDDFELSQVLSKNRSVGFTLLQSGSDRNPWTSSVAIENPPTVRHVHDGVPYQLEFVAMSFERELVEGDEWKDGRRAFRIGNRVRFEDRDALEVFVQEGAARNHKLIVDVATKRVVSLTQRVFMGRGDEFRLTLQLDAGHKATPDADAKFFDRIQKLRRAARVPSQPMKNRLTADQLALIETALPDLKQAAKTRWAARVMDRIQRETTEQTQRTQRIADLQKAIVGKSLSPIIGKTVDGKAFDSAALDGNVVVLHVWQYRDEPLTEPYGQTAYLDFMQTRFAKEPVRVVGINVDTRLSDKTLARKANRSARKLVEFMNLSYPIVGNDGSILKELGDPRSAGTKLPLWIVLDKTGKARLWKAGYYKVESRRGLEELDRFVKTLLKP